MLAWYPLARWLPVRLLPFVLLLAASSTEARHFLGDTLYSLIATQSECGQPACLQTSSPSPALFELQGIPPHPTGALHPPALALLGPRSAGQRLRLESGSLVPHQQIRRVSPRAPPAPV
ncbi:MAG TPA: hypothetical protein VFS50_07270 [Meiothermus sp.]|nr:hypothetical protein [Meiothermus sp.]